MSEEKSEGQSFVMPESDGIRNGVPLGDEMEGRGGEQPDLTPQGFNQRMRDAASGKSSADSSDEGVASSVTAQSSGLMRTSGFSIKAKLMASLSLLTLIILTLGVISFTSIVEINDLSVSIADRQSALAKITESIKVSVFRARDAEKDFLIKEEQEALDRSGRFITKLRGQLEKATELGTEIEKATGAQTTDQYLKMSDSVDAYEQQFSEQVKNVKEARSSVNQDLVRTNESKNELTVRSAELRLLVKGVVDDYWINTKNGLKQNITDARATATEAASTATLAKQAADKKLEEDGRSAGAELKEEQLLAAEQLEASAALAKQALIDAGAAAQRKVVVARSEADKQLTESARIARADFDREADRAIREAALAGTARGNEAGASTLKGNDNDSSAAAAVKKVAVEAQERLAKESAETARVNADSAVEAQALAAAAAAAATEQLSSQSRDALLISAENAAAASEKVANAAVSTANRIFERSNEAAEAALSRTLTVNRKTVESVNMGSKLSDLDRELLSVQIQVARYLQLNKQSFVDSALASVDTALAISDQVRRESGDEKVTLQMGEVRKQLIEYQRQFRDVVAESDAVAEALIQANSQIDQQKDQLRQTGEQLLNLATQLSDGAWGEISSQSRELQITGSEAQNLLMVLVVVGVLLGGFVLYAVPRPILAAINQLLMGAQRVAAGDLTQAISVDSRDELGQLATTFDHMRANLMSLVDRIQCASVQISTTVNEIQAASSQQSATSTEQAGSLNEFSVTLRQIAQSSEQLASSATTVAKSSGGIATKVGDANNRSSQMMESMNAIGESTRQTSDRIKALNDQMDTITDAVSAISGVADQTTLLSLNAAIEANKAGEMGKGFSVVATEIRRLSDRSIDSAGGIGGMVRDIQRATESSVVSMDKSSEEIRLGIELVEDSTATMQEVNLNMGEISSRTEEIAVGVNQQAVSSTEAQQTITELLNASNIAAQAARQTSSAAYELNAMATQLSDAVAAFRT